MADDTSSLSPRKYESEAWANIPDCPGYQASTLGRVRSRRQRGPGHLLSDQWKILKLTERKGTRNRGYVKVTIAVNNGKMRTFEVHRLVLLAFVGHPEGDLRTRHLNGIRNDNRLSNLSWGTAAENAADTIAHRNGKKVEGRPRCKIPLLKKHPTKDEARCWVGGRYIHLGKWDSEAASKAYERLLAELRVAPAEVVAGRGKTQVSIDDLATAFYAWALEHYRREDGQHTSEVRSFRDALRVVCELYGMTPAREFGPLALKAVRQRFVDLGWCRGVVNKQVTRVRRVFRWAVGEELLPEETHRALCCVGGLQKGRSQVRETEEIQPVPRGDVTATLPFLSRHVRAMVELQLLTGMRPGEVCGLTLGEIDRTGEAGSEVWVYRPEQHKTRHRGQGRAIPFGPKARELLVAFLGDRVIESTANVFSPWQAREEAYAAMRARRKTKVQPSQVTRRKENAKRVPRQFYTTESYAHAVERGAEKAGVGHWHPNQLRHTVGTEVRRVYGLEAAGALLGHTKMSATEVYAERDRTLAARVASEMG